MAEPHQAQFLPISPNPFIVGNPVRDPSMFFGREAEFDLVQKRFQQSKQGGLLVFCGERRSGKTSILFQIVAGRLGPDFIPVLIDMQSMAIDNEITFLQRIADEILVAIKPFGEDVSPPNYSAGSKPSAIFMKFIEDILRAHKGKKLILLFDEYELFESKIDSGVLSRDILYVLSSLMEHLSVFLVFTGSQHIEARRRQYWSILGKSIYRRVSFLNREDTDRLITTPLRGRVTWDRGVKERIYRLGAGFPFYTQAICQNIVDALNERRTLLVTTEILDSVVRGILTNPFPQMIFQWESLEQDYKLTLALHADIADVDDVHASVDDIHALVANGTYPLSISRPQIASSLEALSERELLVKNMRSPPGYAFRADLWRMWIRRMHSVWQVVQEEGIETKLATPRWSMPKTMILGLVTVGIAVAVLFVVPLRHTVFMPGQAVSVSINVDPTEAVISMDGEVVGVGSLLTKLGPGRDHNLHIASPGYSDTSLKIRPANGSPIVEEIALRPLRGAVRVITEPAGASISLDGKVQGRSPLTITDIAVPEPHLLGAFLDGFRSLQVPLSVRPDTVLIVTLELSSTARDLRITTDPEGAVIVLDGVVRGLSPITVRRIAIGQHSIVVRLKNYNDFTTSLDITRKTGDLHFILTRENKPPR